MGVDVFAEQRRETVLRPDFRRRVGSRRPGGGRKPTPDGFSIRRRFIAAAENVSGQPLGGTGDSSRSNRPGGLYDEETRELGRSGAGGGFRPRSGKFKGGEFDVGDDAQWRNRETRRVGGQALKFRERMGDDDCSRAAGARRSSLHPRRRVEGDEGQ